jgi:alcohol dehydrogenase
MLGATHSCANPLTAKYGTPHGEAIALLLPSVVRWNAAVVGERYAELLRIAGLSSNDDPGEALARRLEQLARAGKLPQQLRTIGVPHKDLAALAEAAARQWTGTFNPRAWSAAGAYEVYQWAY